MTNPTGKIRVASSFLDQLGVDDVRALLQVEVEELDPSRAARDYRIELHTANGRVASLDLAGARSLAGELHHKLQVAAAMQSNPPRRLTPPT